MSNNNSFFAFFTGAVMGGLAGAAAGVLMAPDKGENTRKKIMDKAKESKDKLEKFSEQEIKPHLHKAKDEIKLAAENVKKEVQRTAEQMK